MTRFWRLGLGALALLSVGGWLGAWLGRPGLWDAPPRAADAPDPAPRLAAAPSAAVSTPAPVAGASVAGTRAAAVATAAPKPGPADADPGAGAGAVATTPAWDVCGIGRVPLPAAQAGSSPAETEPPQHLFPKLAEEGTSQRLLALLDGGGARARTMGFLLRTQAEPGATSVPVDAALNALAQDSSDPHC